MEVNISEEFKIICKEILNLNKTVEEWCQIEADDMFQTNSYEGGFDATEKEFCFSVFVEDIEYWFQVSLNEVKQIDEDLIDKVQIKIAE